MTTESKHAGRIALRGGRAIIKRGAGRIAARAGAAMALGVLGMPGVFAQVPVPAVPVPTPAVPVPAPAVPAAAPAKRTADTGPGRFYAFGGFAAFAPQNNGQLQGERNKFGLIAGGGYRITPGLALELNYLFDHRRLDTPASSQQPAPGTFQPGTLKSYLFSSGVAATVKFSFTVDRLSPHAGAGFGVYSTGFRTTSQAIACFNNCTDTGPRVTARSTDLGYHALIGADFHITRKDMVSAEIRYLKLEADFGSVLPGNINAGGTFFWLGYRRAF